MNSIHQLAIFAARSANLALLKERIEAGADPNYVDAQYGSPLAAAIAADSQEIVEYLLSIGASVNIEYHDSIGPLEIALYHSNKAIAYRLVCAGAKLKRTALPFYRARLDDILKEMHRKNTDA